LAEQYDIKTIAFPSISTGAYGFPVDQAAKIAIREIKRFLVGHTSIAKVILVCFGDKVYQQYLATTAEMAEP